MDFSGHADIQLMTVKAHDRKLLTTYEGTCTLRGGVDSLNAGDILESPDLNKDTDSHHTHARIRPRWFCDCTTAGSRGMDKKT